MNPHINEAINEIVYVRIMYSQKVGLPEKECIEFIFQKCVAYLWENILHRSLRE